MNICFNNTLRESGNSDHIKMSDHKIIALVNSSS